MSEVYFMGWGPPKQHKEFRKWISTLEYPFIGARKGYCKPFLCNGVPYSVKLKDECMPLFLGDLKASTSEISGKFSHVFGLLNALTNWPVKLANFFMRRRGQEDMLGTVDMKKIPKGNDTFKGWFYTKVFFKSNDVTRRGQEEL